MWKSTNIDIAFRDITLPQQLHLLQRMVTRIKDFTDKAIVGTNKKVDERGDGRREIEQKRRERGRQKVINN